MSSLYKKTDHLYTYAEYCTWPPEDRWELIHGQPWSMSPAPNRRHQMVAGEIYRQFSNWLQDKSCNVFIAPFDVLLPDVEEQDDSEISTIVQPDVVVFCDKTKLKDYGAKGAPDLVVEVLSPFTRGSCKSPLLQSLAHKVIF
jgi:Uma2 family endonuclease